MVSSHLTKACKKVSSYEDQNQATVQVAGSSARRGTVVEGRGTNSITLFPSRCIQGIGKIQDTLTTNGSLLVIILDLNIDDMDRSVKGRASVHEVIHNGVPASFFAGNDNIDQATLSTLAATVLSVLQARHTNLPILPALWAPFDPAITIQHIQDTIILIQSSVLGLKFLEHAVASGRENPCRRR
ncbi:hypothetical protein HG531_001758 [Fusarium graminearum]|nr:hypothetical protein HG531_001758 [Fusarium graminearum]